MKNKAIHYLTFFFFIFSACFAQSAPPQKGPYRYMHVEELRERLKRKENLVVFDVRSSYAYQMEHIAGAHSLPLQEIQQQVPTHPLSKQGLIVTYCACPHHLAEMAFDLLGRLGYHNVYVLDEGLPGWKRNAYPLEGSLANKPIRVFWVVGNVLGPAKKPRPDVEIRLYQPTTQQLEIAKTDKHGFYAIPLRFYGLNPGDQLQVSLGGDVIFFTVGDKKEPWGTRIDDVESHINVVPEQFLKVYKQKKLNFAK